MSNFPKAIYSDFLKHRYFYLVLIALVFCMALTLHASMQGADGRRYLRWTHSFIFDQDLHLLNDFEAAGGSYNLTPTGYIFELANIGTPLLWSPFYGAASFFMPALPRSEPYPADTPLQLLWLNFSSWIYTILAGILTFSTLRRWFEVRGLMIAMLAILLGTPILFYTATYPMSVHPSNIFLSALLLYLWLTPGPKRFLHYLSLGIVIGWLMLVASYNIVFFLLPGFSLLRDGLTPRHWLSVGLNGLALGLGGLIGFLPQMVVFWFLFGSFFYSPYAGQLLWAEPYLFGTLLSTFHGLFFYAPVLLLVIPGLWWLRRRDPWLALSLGLIWLALTYIVSVNVAWWAGTSFGNRYFLTLSPFFVLGLAAFLQAAKKWGLVLTILAVLWTLGLYLQVLGGVRLPSDSIIYSAATLAQGQLNAFANSPAVLPYLWAEWPWLSAPVILLPLFGLILLGLSRLVYGWSSGAQSVNAGQGRRISLKIEPILVAISLALILFIAWAGLRGEQTKAVLAGQGFYEQSREVVYHQVREVAGRSGLVTRAMYHEYMGQPDQALADLQRAATLWKSDPASAPTRLYLGPAGLKPLDLPLHLHLDYPGNVRLVGYQILEAGPSLISGQLFWQKLAGEESKAVITPIIRAFDQTGSNLGNISLDFPFPAEYIPVGGLFQDNFTLPLDHPADAWVWLAVNLAEDPNAPPLNAQGQAESGIIGSVKVGAASPPPLASAENAQTLLDKAELLGGPVYQPGQIIPLLLTGQVPTQAAADTRLDLTLLDATGTQAQFTFHNSHFTILNSTTYCLPVPATLPPGDYRLSLALQPPENGQEPNNPLVLPLQIASTASSSLTTICDLLQAGFARRYEAPAPQNPLEAGFAKQIKLLGYDLSVIPQAGAVLARVTLHWQAQTRVTQNYLVSVQLLDAGGQPVSAHTGVPVHETRPTSTWLKQEVILDEHLLTVPVLAPGVYHLSLTLLAEPTSQPVEVSGQPQLILQDVSVP